MSNVSAPHFFIHVDGDAFFASVEQCLHKELRGKPIVVGRDGSISVALSYEAKRLGVKRVTPIYQIRKEFPEVQVVASDYFMYQLFAKRMLAICRRHIASMRQRSIDECCADISTQVQSYAEAEHLGRRLKTELETCLGCTFSIGIASSPLLAKLASGLLKPSGFNILNPAEDISYQKLPVYKVSGFGPQLCASLAKRGVHTIGDFLQAFPGMRAEYSVVLQDMYEQLSGRPASRRLPEKPQQSMSRARSFKVTYARDEVFGQLVLHYEHLLRKLRSGRLVCARVGVGLKTADGEYREIVVTCLPETRNAQAVLVYMKAAFAEVWQTSSGCRYVGLTFSGLRPEAMAQGDLFSDSTGAEEGEALQRIIDTLSDRCGHTAVSLASTLVVPKKLGSAKNTANDINGTKNHSRRTPTEPTPIIWQHPFLPGESTQKRLRYPFLGTI